MSSVTSVTQVTEIKSKQVLIENKEVNLTIKMGPKQNKLINAKTKQQQTKTRANIQGQPTIFRH